MSNLVPIVVELQEHHGRIRAIEEERKAEALVTQAEVAAQTLAAQTRTASLKRIWAVITAVVVPIVVTLILVIH